MTKRTRMNETRMCALIAAAAGMALAPAALGQDYDEHYEWEADEGLHEEEWYDPSDWFDDDFDDDRVDYEADWYESGTWDDDYYDYGDDYDYGYYGDDRAINDGYDGPFTTYNDGTWIVYYTYEDPTGQRDMRTRQDSQRGQGAQSDWERQTDQNRRRQMRATQDQRQTQQDRQMASRQAELRGTLDGWREVDLQGQRDAHTLIRVRLEDGTAKVVNLGPNVNKSDLELQRDKQIVVRGTPGRIDGRDVLMAQRVSIGDNTVRTPEWTPSQQARGQQGQNQWQGQGGQAQQRAQSPDRQRQMQGQQRAQSGMHPQAEQVRRIVESWPQTSREAAKKMLQKYGKPAVVSREMLAWTDTGNFVKTVVYGHTVDHNFPMPHEDVLEQYVNYEVPADKMDELARFDGSISVFRTDGLMSVRCDNEAANILALNLAHEIVRGDKSVEEARRTYAETIRRSKQEGQSPSIMQELAFDTSSRNTQSADWADERFQSAQARGEDE